MIQLLLLFSSLVPTLQHGYLLWPPNRSSLWRYGYNTTKNYNDNALYCGGRMLLEESNGKCGVCGDPYIGPRKHEAGGLYASGIIAAKYPLDTKTITVTVLLTVNHQGYFEFRLCPHNEPTVPVTQRCLDKFLLPIQEGSIKHRKMRFYPKEELGHAYNLSLDIPRGMICTQCVLQWRYHTENSWGFDPNGTSCIGCGLQEEFYNCADISIGEDEHVSKNKYDNPYSIERTLEQNGT
ncbi:uncharacterized protein LOC127723863 [Mytilus californianus]|uniref:uncharacterized protein LOC127723863 n=1 Tax=Mytilus californianus TaxID=6549 RepID=UPI00224849BC|nr:uncharacterized protein LOC127723863 [Mytilus californianus]